MNNYFADVILENWEDIDVLADVEENDDDIIVGIQYQNHGDEFIVIKTKDSVFEYGYYLNRYGFPDYSELSDSSFAKRFFIRMPKLFRKEDTRCSISNDIFFEIRTFLYDDVHFTARIAYDKRWAQMRLDNFIDYLSIQYDKGYMYRSNGCSKVIKFLYANDIASEENIEKVKTAKWNSKINGADGIAGKRLLDADNKRIYVDSIHKIVYRGKTINPKKVKMKTNGYDEWGEPIRFLSLDQFK